MFLSGGAGPTVRARRFGTMLATMLTRSLPLRWPIGLLALAVVISACGGEPSLPVEPSPVSVEAVVQTSGDVHPLAEIVVSGPEFTDLQPDSVTVALDTSIPVACSVVYGTTNEYGQIAVDTDMAGSGHNDHHPVMSHLEPDTTYYLRFQGTGPDGTLYRSEEYTVRTLADSDAKAPEMPGGKNLALPANGGSISRVSSNFGGGGNGSSFGANDAIDGNMGSEWSSQGGGDDAWIEIELAEEAEVLAVGFRTRTMGDSAQIFTFQIVADGRATSGPFELPASNSIYYFPVTIVASRLRFEAVTTSGGNTGAVEIEVYGEFMSALNGM
jgi:hypothetical protein